MVNLLRSLHQFSTKYLVLLNFYHFTYLDGNSHSRSTDTNIVFKPTQLPSKQSFSNLLSQNVSLTINDPLSLPPCPSHFQDTINGQKRTRYSGLLRSGRSGDRIPVEARSSAPVQTGPGTHPAFCSLGAGALSREQRGRDVAMTTHHHPELRLGMDGAIPLLIQHRVLQREIWRGMVGPLYCGINIYRRHPVCLLLNRTVTVQSKKCKFY
jgi:hypothetical protein